MLSIGGMRSSEAGDAFEVGISAPGSGRQSVEQVESCVREAPFPFQRGRDGDEDALPEAKPQTT